MLLDIVQDQNDLVEFEWDLKDECITFGSVLYGGPKITSYLKFRKDE